MSAKTLIVGATSLLGRSLSYQYALDGDEIILAGRNIDELKIISCDIAIRYGANTHTLYIDLSDDKSCLRAASDLLDKFGCPDTILFVSGHIGNVENPYQSINEISKTARINYFGMTLFLARLLPNIESTRNTDIVFISSVAGDRGRKTNFVYGAAKAALNTYAQGLRAMLHQRGCGVYTIKLGYMDTRLAFGKTPRLITCTPDYAARAIRRAVERRKYVIYVPWFWRFIMLFLRLLPEKVFIRLPLP